MNDEKERALEKMLEEMNKDHSSTEDAIHNWLCNQSDAELFQGILTKGKSIRESVEFCGSKARELAIKGVAMVTDEDVFAWVREYFVMKDIKFDKPAMSAATSKSNKPAVKKPKAKKTAKKVADQQQGEQLDLLSFL